VTEPADHQSGLDLSALRGWLDEVHPGVLSGPLTATQLTGGRSNLTFLVEAPQTRAVLRRPPLGEHPATAHDVGREFRIIASLADSAVPVPMAILLCTDRGAIGAPFYLMQYVDGLVLRSREDLAPYDVDAKSRLADRLMAALADIHDVDLAATGLADLGRPEGYLQRQLDRWQRHLDVWASDSPNLESLHALGRSLAVRVPESARISLVHGDFRLDNLIVDEELDLLAVLDWEMATVGDPLADLGLFLVYWDLAGEADNALSTAMGPAAGFPCGGEMARRYAERMGADVTDLDWYVALGGFKLAVVLEGVRQRESRHPVPGHRSVAGLIPVLAEHARRRL
jgi:aminoglycoside phosphotransferase (APT) family kinase protein